MLDIRNLSASYGMHRALADVNIRVDAGEVVVILGANGAGKSTLLRAVSGTCEGSVEGDVVLDGSTISHLPAEQIVDRGIAFVPEGRGIFGDLTVAENLSLGAYSSQARASQAENLSKVYSLFPKLRERQSQTSRTMSGGEQQMVAIGRAMMSAPQILMLDEPSLGLSPLLCKELFANLKSIKETGLGILLVEQNAKQSLAIADRGYLIENGEITGENTANKMLNDPAVQSAYLGGAASTSSSGHNEPSSTPPPVHYITPGVSEVEHASDSAATVDIGALVSRAEQTSYQPPSEPLLSAPSGSKSVSVSKPNSGTSYGDAEIEQLLSDMEQSAQNARLATPHSKSPTPTSRRTISDDTELLPDIPVYRKSTVEIYRRETDGQMHKVDKK
ncbi:MAG: ABC transporter ATP-binding protein [Rhizobiaceae bacterium]